jgi:predicted aconitase
MELSEREQAILDGEKGDAMSKVMKTLVMYGETFGANKMVAVTSKNGHLVTSFGLSMIKAVYQLMDTLIKDNALAVQPFSVNPRPQDKRIPANLLQKIVFRVMYSKQTYYDKQLQKMGLLSDKAFTCTCYMDEVGNTPQEGEVLSWAESSAVVYANSVLGARCNRNSGIIEMFGSIAGCVPYFGLLTDEGRRASWIVEIKTAEKPEAQLLGSAIGLKVMEDVPYIRGLDAFLGNELTQNVRDYLKDMGAASASNGSVGLYHVENLTPEAVKLGGDLIVKDAKTYVIDDEELKRIRAGYPCIWKNKNAKPKLAFVGCPHLSLQQLTDWTKQVAAGLKEAGRTRVSIPTVFTAAPEVLAAFEKTENAQLLQKTGVILSNICPLMHLNNPFCNYAITNSNKLRTYTSALYCTDSEMLKAITRGWNS